MVGIFHSYTSVIHDFRVLDFHSSSSFVCIDNRDFLRENGEVGLVLGIRERRKLRVEGNYVYLHTLIRNMVILFALIKRGSVLLVKSKRTEDTCDFEKSVKLHTRKTIKNRLLSRTDDVTIL
jgi:hypothetical protein